MNEHANPSSKRIRIGHRVTIVPRGARGTYSADFSDGGIHRRVSLRTRNRRIATQRALRIEAQLADGEYAAKPKAVSIQLALTDYLAAKRIENRSPKTFTKYRTELESFNAFAARHGLRTLQQISARLFDQYRAARREGRSEKTAYTEAIIIKGFLKWCLRRELIAQDPLRFCQVTKPPMLPRMSPSLAQVNLLLEGVKRPRRIQLAVLAFTGMRAGELQMLRPEDVDLENSWLHVVARDDWAPKNRRSRRIPIHSRLREYLEEMPPSERPYFFCAQPSPKYPSGNHHINTKHLNEDLQKVAQRLGIPVGRKRDGLVIHSLRHFFETHCVNSRVPQRVIDEWMGHTGDRSMGSVYYRLGDKDSQAFMASVPF